MKSLFSFSFIFIVAITCVASPLGLQAESKEIYREFSTLNSTGRSGVYYLPRNFRRKARPAVLLFHGSSINGAAVARLFKSLARKKKFIIIAPDSLNTFGWEISLDPSTPTEDQTHIAACLSEVQALKGVSIDPSKFLVAGISAGGELAGYFGSNDTSYSSFAVLHGGVHIASLGSNIVPVWLSTGTDDTLRTPEELTSYLSPLSQHGFTDATYTEYPAAHEVKKKERKGLVSWWLD